MDSEPDERAGAVSKTDDGLRAAGCKSSTVRHFIPVAQEKSRRLLTGRSKVRLLPGMLSLPAWLDIPMSRGTARTRLWKVELLYGTQSGQARRGPVLTGSCRRQSGMGCKSSAFRHFHTTLSSSETGHLTFNQKTRGQFPAGWPLSYDRIV